MKRESDRVQSGLDSKVSGNPGFHRRGRPYVKLFDSRHQLLGFLQTGRSQSGVVFSQPYLIDFFNRIILDGVAKLDGRQFSIFPPALLLLKIDVKGKRRRYPRLDGLLDFFRKTVLYLETHLPSSIGSSHLDIVNGGLLTEDREGKNQDKKEKSPSDHPSALTLSSHRFLPDPSRETSVGKRLLNLKPKKRRSRQGP